LTIFIIINDLRLIFVKNLFRLILRKQ